LDEYAGTTDNSSNTAVVASDVRTVTYFLTGSSAPASSIVPSDSTNVAGSGLVRSELDRTAAQFAVQQGSSTIGNDPEVIAPEVLDLEFQYFDGTDWQTSWDTTASSALPQLVRISIILADPSKTQTQNGMATSVADASTQDPDSVYTIVVRMPACDPMNPDAAGTSASSSSDSSNSSGAASGASGTSGTSGSGGSGS
jgi:hypothetical protein